MARARDMPAFALASAPDFGLASCKSNAPEQVVANGAKDDGVM